jgi:hypothetical protein
MAISFELYEHHNSPFAIWLAHQRLDSATIPASIEIVWNLGQNRFIVLSPNYRIMLWQGAMTLQIVAHHHRIIMEQQFAKSSGLAITIDSWINSIESIQPPVIRSGGRRWLCILLLHWNPMVISNKMQSRHGPPYQQQQPQKWIDWFDLIEGTLVLL